MKKRLYEFLQPNLFRSALRRGSDGKLVNNNTAVDHSVDFEGTNFESTSSFRYASTTGPIKSTQQINIDYSKFENHTFFDSAISKVNIAIDKIINHYPFDGTLQEIEDFEDKLTGFENYVLTNFPKNLGYLHLSGTQAGEDSLSFTGANLGNFILIKDMPDSSFGIDKNAKSEHVLNLGDAGLTVEFKIYLPVQSNDNEIIFQKKESETKHMSLSLEKSTSTKDAGIKWSMIDGTNETFASSSLKKGAWQSVVVQYDNTNQYRKNKIIIDSILKSTASKSAVYDNIIFDTENFTIGSGSSIIHDGSLFSPARTLSASIDEFRFFNKVLSIDDIKKNTNKNIYNTKDLQLYFRFNETTGSHVGNDVCLDMSGNSLHTSISNYTTNCRIKHLGTPLSSELSIRNPILFPGQSEVKDLNNDLFTTASNYDLINPNLIFNLVPRHYLTFARDEKGSDSIYENLKDKITSDSMPTKLKRGSGQLMMSMLLIYAKYYDELKIFIDHFSKLVHVDYDDFDSSADNFLYFVGKYYGIELPSFFKRGKFEQLFNGIDITAGGTKSEAGLIQVQNKIWRRILANLPQTQLSAGTQDSVRMLFRSIGIEPDTLFEIKEYGGPRTLTLSGSRQQVKKVSKFLNFSGSMQTDVVTTDSQGYNTKKPYFVSSFLSGSRITVGNPRITRKNATATLTIGLNAVDTSLLASGDSFKIEDALGQRIQFELIDFGGAAPTLPIVGVPMSAGNVTARNGAQIAADIETAVNTSAINIKATALSNVVTFTQNIASPDGNTDYDDNVAGQDNLTGSNFSGGMGFAKKGNNHFHGIASSGSDGLFTSGSFTYEARYRFEPSVNYPVTQSLARLIATGSSTYPLNLLANVLLCKKNDEQYDLKFVAKPSTSTDDKTLELTIHSASLLDGDIWNISFGRERNDLMGEVSSSYFLRAGKIIEGDYPLVYHTSSHYSEDSINSLFEKISHDYNASGSFITIGSQSIPTNTNNLNSVTLSPMYKQTLFGGSVNQIRFWSKSLSLSEWTEHIRNPFSLGVKNPLVNFNFTERITGSFERLRIDHSFQQFTTASNDSGELQVFDFSQNNKHGIFYLEADRPKIPLNKNIDEVYNILSPKFDVRATNQKIRVRSLSNKIKAENYNVRHGNVHQIYKYETPEDDTRFSIDLSVVKALNEDIMNLFENFDFLEDALGKPNILYENHYPDLISLRRVYFNRLIDKIDIEKFKELFKWLDDSLTDLILQLLPARVNFLGVNHVIESHVLERHRVRYNWEEVYEVEPVDDPGGSSDFDVRIGSVDDQ